MARGRLFVVSGPSGAGKGTIIRSALERRPEVVLSVSATTRAPRPGESAGDHYHFVSAERFRTMIDEGEFLEWAEIYGRHLSGTPRVPVEQALAEGKDVILELDIQGAAAVKQAIPEAVLVFVEPPTMEVLAKRLRARGTEDAEALAPRIEAAYEEIKAGHSYDHIVVNDQVERAVEDFLRILDEPGTIRPGAIRKD